MRVEVWPKGSGWRVVADGAIVADGLPHDEALRVAASLAEHGQVIELVVHYAEPGPAVRGRRTNGVEPVAG